jgi:DNA sulfur modification protein DndE
MTFQHRLAAITLSLGPVLGLSPSPAQAGLLSPGPLATSLIATEGYAYGYPLVLMDETLAGTTGPTRACGFEGQINSFFHVFDIPGPNFRAVVRPNVDTLYSSAFLDLREGPQLLDMPAVKGRYVLMALLDAWTNNFAGLGTASHGEQPGHYLIAGPGWQGQTPAGYTRIDAPTPLVWIIGRTEVRGPDDVAAVNALQRQYRLRSLSGVPSPVDDTPCVPRTDPSQTPPAIVDALSGPDFFKRLSALMAENPPPAADEPMLRKLAPIGVGPYASSTVDQLPLRTRSGWADIPLRGVQEILDAEVGGPA